jgi:hypothetical protein
MSVKVILYPLLTSRDDYLGEVFRAVWFASAAEGRIDRIVLLASEEVASEPVDELLTNAAALLPGYMDPTIAALAARWIGKVSVLSDENALLDLETGPAFVGLLSRLTEAQDAFAHRLVRKYGGLQSSICRRTCLPEAINCLTGVHALTVPEEEQRRRNLDATRRFREFADALAGLPVNICGTGPSLSSALDSGYDFSQGVNIVCNSAVTNRDLLAKLRPRFIIAGDPVFHGGPSLYAGAFRRDLDAALRDHDALLITQPSYTGMFKAVLDPAVHDRILGLPPASLPSPNIDLTNQWVVDATENILTLFMLPVACSVGRDINIFGCDGRSYLENSYFWGHDKKVQYTDLMQSAFDAHPAFFERNFDYYLITHCTTLEAMLALAETQNKTVASRSPSYLPPLAKRFKAVT